MEKFNTKNLYLQELTAQELEKTDGGLWAIFFAGMAVGAFVYCYTHY